VKVKDSEMGRACSMYEENRNAYRVILTRDYFQDISIQRRTILKWALKRCKKRYELDSSG